MRLFLKGFYWAQSNWLYHSGPFFILFSVALIVFPLPWCLDKQSKKTTCFEALIYITCDSFTYLPDAVNMTWLRDPYLIIVLSATQFWNTNTAGQRTEKKSPCFLMCCLHEGPHRAPPGAPYTALPVKPEHQFCVCEIRTTDLINSPPPASPFSAKTSPGESPGGPLVLHNLEPLYNTGPWCCIT